MLELYSVSSLTVGLVIKVINFILTKLISSIETNLHIKENKISRHLKKPEVPTQEAIHTINEENKLSAGMRANVENEENEKQTQLQLKHSTIQQGRKHY